MKARSALLERLVCLQCRTVLDQQPAQLVCSNCGRTYPLVDGVPVILPVDSRIVHALDPDQGSGPGARIRRLGVQAHASLPENHLGAANADNMGFLRAQLHPQAGTLLVGGGIRKHGDKVEMLGPELMAQAVNLDVEPGPVVDLVADGHCIPFEDETFDLVISQAVLEHVRGPQLMIVELGRVLKPGGWILVDVPFLWPIHMHSDFSRYTPMGLAELLAEFEPVSTGTNAGLGSAAALLSAQFWATLLSFGNRKLFHAMQLLTVPLSVPLKYFDLLFKKFNVPAVAPASTFFIGRKRSGEGE